jgi:hypothetical protein
MKNKDRDVRETRRNGSGQSQQEDRFGEGQSHEGQRIAGALSGQAGHQQPVDDGASAGGPSAEEIAQRAYERYLARGEGEGGSPEDDWLAAEEELRRDRTRS